MESTRVRRRSALGAMFPFLLLLVAGCGGDSTSTAPQGDSGPALGSVVPLARQSEVHATADGPNTDGDEQRELFGEGLDLGDFVRSFSAVSSSANDFGRLVSVTSNVSQTSTFEADAELRVSQWRIAAAASHVGTIEAGDPDSGSANLDAFALSQFQFDFRVDDDNLALAIDGAYTTSGVFFLAILALIDRDVEGGLTVVWQVYDESGAADPGTFVVEESLPLQAGHTYEVRVLARTFVGVARPLGQGFASEASASLEAEFRVVPVE